MAAAPGSAQCGPASVTVTGSGRLYSYGFFGLAFDFFLGNEAVLEATGVI